VSDWPTSASGPADRDELRPQTGRCGTATGIRQIGRSVLDHLDAHDALRPWAAGLAEAPGGASLAGHLTGSIDLIMRVTGPSGQPRFVVADYKTNALHPRGMAVRAGDYGPPRLVEAMSEHDYPLQALLYSVALHRYLRWRLRGYDQPCTWVGPPTSSCVGWSDPVPVRPVPASTSGPSHPAWWSRSATGWTDGRR